jgi:DNA-binding transcriptional ArsR family regulator
LSEALGITPSAVSQHLKVLKYAGMVRGERKGYYLPYEIDAEAMNKCQEMLTEVCTCGCKDAGPVGKVEMVETEGNLSQLKKLELELKKELKEVQARIAKLNPMK